MLRTIVYWDISGMLDWPGYEVSVQRVNNSGEARGESTRYTGACSKSSIASRESTVMDLRYAFGLLPGYGVHVIAANPW